MTLHAHIYISGLFTPTSNINTLHRHGFVCSMLPFMLVDFTVKAIIFARTDQTFLQCQSIARRALDFTPAPIYMRYNYQDFHKLKKVHKCIPTISSCTSASTTVDILWHVGGQSALTLHYEPFKFDHFQSNAHFHEYLDPTNLKSSIVL